jgi:hypothetical protein
MDAAGNVSGSEEVRAWQADDVRQSLSDTIDQIKKLARGVQGANDPPGHAGLNEVAQGPARAGHDAIDPDSNIDASRDDGQAAVQHPLKRPDAPYNLRAMWYVLICV